MSQRPLNSIKTAVEDSVLVALAISNTSLRKRLDDYLRDFRLNRRALDAQKLWEQEGERVIM